MTEQAEQGIPQVNPFEQLDVEYTGTLRNISQFFRDRKRSGLQKNLVFAAGTAPMGTDTYRSEMETLLYCTDFDEATCVDPHYAEPDILNTDIRALQELTGNVNPDQDHHVVRFTYAGRERVIRFVAGDATVWKPDQFTIFFSGRRVAAGDEKVRGTPSDFLPEIVAALLNGGYLVPDRDLNDDTFYFRQHSAESLGLQEVEGIRVPERRESEDFERSDEIAAEKLKAQIEAHVLDPLVVTVFENFEPSEIKKLSELTQQNSGTIVIYSTGILMNGEFYPFAYTSADESQEKGYEGYEVYFQCLKEARQETTTSVTVPGIGLYKKVTKI